MLERMSGNVWVRQVAVFLGYVLAYNLIRPYSDGIWSVTSGFRLGCLLLLPYRYWAALVLGEFVPLAYNNFQCLTSFGPVWTILSSIPPMLIAAPIVAWCKRRLSLFPSRRQARVKPLLICILLVSCVWTVVDVIALLAVVQPATATPYHFEAPQAALLFLGIYTGILTVVPLILALKLQSYQGSLRENIERMAKNPLILDSIMLLLPMVAVLAWINYHVPADARQMVCMAMFLPMAWLTLKHGWRAAALGSTITITAIFLNTPSLRDPGLIDIQAFVVFTATCLFALGARIAAQNAVEELERREARNAVRVAQQGLYLCEMRMRQAAHALEHMGGTLKLTQIRLLNRFKYMLPVVEGQNYYNEAVAAQNLMSRLAESMHPTAWRERELPSALDQTIARMLGEIGIAYRCELNGRGLSQLSPSVHAAIYRAACEIVVHISSQRRYSDISLVLRGGLTNGQRWAVLRIEGTATRLDINDPVYQQHDTQQLASKLGAMGLGLDGLRDHIRLYNGELHARTTPTALRITALMHDANSRMQEPSSRPALGLCLR